MWRAMTGFSWQAGFQGSLPGLSRSDLIEKFLERSIGVSAATIFEIISTRYVGDSSISEAKIVVDVFRTLFL